MQTNYLRLWEVWNLAAVLAGEHQAVCMAVLFLILKANQFSYLFDVTGFLHSLAPGPLCSSSKPEKLHLSGFCSVVTSASGRNWERSFWFWGFTCLHCSQWGSPWRPSASRSLMLITSVKPLSPHKDTVTGSGDYITVIFILPLCFLKHGLSVFSYHPYFYL